MEIVKAVLIGGLLTAILSFVMVYFAIKRGYLALDEDIGELNKRKKVAKKEKADFNVNPVHSKWLFFGGGYYGIMALGTYAHVEFLEVWEFLSDFSSIENFIDQVTVGAIIRLIIESFMNLIPAFTWFLYWPKIITMESGFYWLIGSYVGYVLGRIAAKYYYNKMVPDKS